MTSLAFYNLKAPIKFFLKSWLFISVLILSGCATLSVPPQDVPQTQNTKQAWTKYQFILTPLSMWTSKGVIGIRIGDQGESANFIWKQNQSEFYIELYGPLGIGAVSIEGNKKAVKLTKNNGDVFRASSAEYLMDQQLGWHVPIYGLYYWGRGLPDPNQPSQIKLNSLGLIANLKQNGWDITYSKYMIQGNQYPLPGKIVMEQDDLRITAINKSWGFK